MGGEIDEQQKLFIHATYQVSRNKTYWHTLEAAAPSVVKKPICKQRYNIFYLRKPFKWSLRLKSIRTNQHSANGLKARTELITLTGDTYYNKAKN